MVGTAVVKQGMVTVTEGIRQSSVGAASTGGISIMGRGDKGAAQSTVPPDAAGRQKAVALGGLFDDHA